MWAPAAVGSRHVPSVARLRPVAGSRRLWSQERLVALASAAPLIETVKVPKPPWRASLRLGRYPIEPTLRNRPVQDTRAEILPGRHPALLIQPQSHTHLCRQRRSWQSYSRLLSRKHFRGRRRSRNQNSITPGSHWSKARAREGAISRPVAIKKHGLITRIVWIESQKIRRCVADTPGQAAEKAALSA